MLAQRATAALDGGDWEGAAGAYLLALHAHASEIGGTAAHNAVRAACLTGVALRTGDPIVLACVATLERNRAELASETPTDVDVSALVSARVACTAVITR
jgi:hypothetical protein